MDRVVRALMTLLHDLDVTTGVLGTHVGPGAWAVFYQVEDGTPAHPDGATAGEGRTGMQDRSGR